MFWQWSRGKAVRRGDWKLVSHGSWGLYNLKNDRSESTDLIKEHPEIAAELEKLWMDWAKEVGASTGAKKKNKKK